ncbi:MAG: RNA methyltransferase [Phycisphaerales bacterium]|nr:RNA methyltransferase [Phycisphaerales bacterium]
MLSKTQSKYIRSLALQKFRKEHQSFIAEGEKIASEWLRSSEKIQFIVALDTWLQEHQQLIQMHPEAHSIAVNEAELQQISSLQTPNKILLVIHAKAKPNVQQIDDWCIALDGIRNPGNMGTILRIADWFGINHIVCSADCVDAFSPKVVQAAMGAHLRVGIYEADLLGFVQNSPLPSIAAALGGINAFQFAHQEKGILIIGNEANGINETLLHAARYQLMIPRYGGAESLNAGVSAGILCAILLGK